MTDSRGLETQETIELMPEGTWGRPYASISDQEKDNEAIVKTRRLQDGGQIHFVVQDFKSPDNVKQMAPSKAFTVQLESKGNVYDIFAFNSSKPHLQYKAKLEKRHGKVVFAGWNIIDKKGEESPFNVPKAEIRGLQVMIVKQKSQTAMGGRASW